MVADTEVEITGGKHEGRIEDCKEKIESTNILSFYYTCGDYCSHTGYGFSFTCKLEDNKLHITSNGGNYNKRDGSLFRLNYSTDDLDFLNRLNDLIVKYQLSLNNGSTTHVDGLPAGIGAAAATGERVIVFNGDGGFQMNIQELATLKERNLNVIIFILNNSELGIIRQWQEDFYDMDSYQTDLANPDFLRIAQSYAIDGVRIDNLKDLDDFLKNDLEGPLVVEIKVDKENIPLPY